MNTLETNEKRLAKQALSLLVKYMKSKAITLTKMTVDGRINSAKNEDEVADELIAFANSSEWFRNQQLYIEAPNKTDNRCWYDFSIVSLDACPIKIFIPVNIKVSGLDRPDNLNCKTGLYYTLTGKNPTFSNNCDWNTYFTLLNRDMNSEQNKDYYFFIVNKADTSDVFFTSLRSLSTVTPNGNNLPFQCNWSKNRVPISRNGDEARDFLINSFRDSIDLINIVNIFHTNMDKYIA